MSVHLVAQSGFGSDSSNYDSVRPDHQPPAVDKLLESLAIPPHGRIVEVGSGTGKFTAHLLNRPENWEIICVEPSDDMRETHKKRQPDVDIRASDAYKLPVEDASVDAIICAQAFHWFGDATALKEFARVLKPGGSLGLIWNFYDRKRWPDLMRLTQQSESWVHERDAPTYKSMEWLQAFDSEIAHQYYVLPLHFWEYKWVRKIEEGNIWNFVRSLSFINRLSPEEKEVLRGHVEEYIKTADQNGAIRRDENGLVEIPSLTDVRWIKRR